MNNHLARAENVVWRWVELYSLSLQDMVEDVRNAIGEVCRRQHERLCDVIATNVSQHSFLTTEAPMYLAMEGLPALEAQFKQLVASWVKLLCVIKLAQPSLTLLFVAGERPSSSRPPTHGSVWLNRFQCCGGDPSEGVAFTHFPALVRDNRVVCKGELMFLRK